MDTTVAADGHGGGHLHVRGWKICTIEQSLFSSQSGIGSRSTTKRSVSACWCHGLILLLARATLPCALHVQVDGNLAGQSRQRFKPCKVQPSSPAYMKAVKKLQIVHLLDLLDHVDQQTWPRRANHRANGHFGSWPNKIACGQYKLHARPLRAGQSTPHDFLDRPSWDETPSAPYLERHFISVLPSWGGRLRGSCEACRLPAGLATLLLLACSRTCVRW